MRHFSRVFRTTVCVFALCGALLGVDQQFVRAAGITYYVSPSGNDANNGTSLAAPFRTIQRCADAAQPGDTCMIRAGTYRETVTVPRSGTAGSPITFMPYNNEVVTISGADVVTGWTAHDLSGGKAIYKANMPWNMNVRVSGTNHQVTNNQIFVDGVMMVEARWPNIPVSAVTRQSNANQARSDSATNLAQYSATYIDSDLAAFPANFWQGGKINFSPGYKIIWGTCDITSSSTNSVSFTCNPDPGAWNNRSSLTGEFYTPGQQNPYYLWGKYGALDAPGEWFRDSGGTLYLWAADSANPSTKLVEARRRLYAFDVTDRSHITIQGVRLFAATIRTGTGTSHLLVDGIEARYLWHFQEITAFYLTPGTRGIELRGSNNTIRNSLLAYAAGSAVTLKGDSGATSNNQVINNVILDAGYMGNQAVIYGSSPGGANSHLVSQNTMYNAGKTMIEISPGLNITYNDVYQSHLQISDLAAIYTWNTDGLGNHIAYNWVHDLYGEFNAALKFWGAHGIYLDDNSRNTYVYRNVTWNTSAPGIFAYGLTQPGWREFFNNTVDGKLSFDVKPGQSNAGTQVRNNLATTSDLSDPNLTLANNYTGNGIYRNQAARDYRLRSDSPAIDQGVIIPPYTDGFIGAAPDIGAMEFGTNGFVAGALIRQQDIAGLNFACAQDTNGATVTCTVTNLPLGRKLPINFEVRVGSASPAVGCWTTMNYTTHLGTALCEGIPVGGQNGSQPIQARLSGGSWSTVGSINLGGLAVFSISPASGPVNGGTHITLTGRRFAPARSQSLYAAPITVNNATGSVLYDYQVLVNVNTAALIAAGKLRPDCGDLRFYDTYESLPYWIEEGCNTANTRIWVKTQSLPTGSSSFNMTYGNAALTSASSGAATFAFFDDFNDGVMNPHISISDIGATVTETGGQMRITGSTNSSNQYSSWGFYLRTWELSLPQNLAFDSELTIVSGAASFKAEGGSGDLNLFGGLPKNIGYWTGSSWASLGSSTINTATPTRQKLSVGYTGAAGNRTARWFENGNFATALAVRSGLGSQSIGFFRYGPDQANVTYDVRFDNLRVREFAFPQPTTSVGSETIATSRFTIGGVACKNIVVLSTTQATCVTPAGTVGAKTVTVTNPDASSANFNSFTYYALRVDTIGIFRPSNATFYLRNSNTTGPADIVSVFGASPDLPVAGDWNGDDIDTIGLYRPSTAQFLLKDSNAPGAPVVYSFTLGNPGDVPFAGDWDGDGKDGVGVFRPTNGRIFLKNTLTTGFANFALVYGIAGDLPVGGDWNNDGQDSPGVYRPNQARFFLTNQVCNNCIPTTNYQFTLGVVGDVPVAGDWNGDGISSGGVFRPSNGRVYLRNALTTGSADIQIIYGIANDRPIAGRWNAPTADLETAPTFEPPR